jgi:hypothetical protein
MTKRERLAILVEPSLTRLVERRALWIPSDASVILFTTRPYSMIFSKISEVNHHGRFQTALFPAATIASKLAQAKERVL